MYMTGRGRGEMNDRWTYKLIAEVTEWLKYRGKKIVNLDILKSLLWEPFIPPNDLFSESAYSQLWLKLTFATQTGRELLLSLHKAGNGVPNFNPELPEVSDIEVSVF